MLKLRQRLTSQNSTIALLIASAIGAVVFTVVAGAFVVGYTRTLISAADWAQHTQDVISVLQRSSLLSERIENGTRLYVLTRDEDQLDRARQSVNLFETNNVRLGALVADSAYQTANVRSLSACAEDLAQLLKKFTPASTVPEIQIQRCQ